jgi:hypothetical protein
MPNRKSFFQWGGFRHNEKEKKKPAFSIVKHETSHVFATGHLPGLTAKYTYSCDRLIHKANPDEKTIIQMHRADGAWVDEFIQAERRAIDKARWLKLAKSNHPTHHIYLGYEREDGIHDLINWSFDFEPKPLGLTQGYLVLGVSYLLIFLLKNQPWRFKIRSQDAVQFWHCAVSRCVHEVEMRYEDFDLNLTELLEQAQK